MMLQITAIYASLLAFIFLWLSARTIAARGRAKVSIGDGENKELLRYIRSHSNFAEYIPFALLLMGISEMLGLHMMILHISGICLIFSRLLHALNIAKMDESLKLRVVAMATTFTVIGILALSNLFIVLSQYF